MTVERPNEKRRPRVVIIGAGFAGLKAARTLANREVDVTIVDRNNYHKFQPLLYQVATAGLEPDEIAQNVRSLFRRAKNVRFHLGTVEAIDHDRHEVSTHDGCRLGYDYLIVAAGTVSTFFGIEGAEEHSFPMKNVPEAVRLRNHVLRQFERYDKDPRARQGGRLNFVIVGGGPTGVEMAGALVELFDILQRDYKDIDTSKARVILVEMLDQLLPGQHPDLGEYAKKVLERRGVQVCLETAVERVTDTEVHLKGGETIPTRTMVWGAGVKADPLAEALGVELAGGGRIPVRDDLSLPDHPEVFAAGDITAAEGADKKMYPQLAAVANQQGEHAAKQILRRIEGGETEAFRYRDYGTMATIGRNAAVGEFPGGIRVKGFIAWLMWVGLHVAMLAGFRNRMNVFINYAINYLTYDRNARLIFDMIPVPEEVPMEVEEVDEEITQSLEEIADRNE
jgi:NADH:ubiquinone reductase (H+-translocating)